MSHPAIKGACVSRLFPDVTRDHSFDFLAPPSDHHHLQSRRRSRPSVAPLFRASRPKDETVAKRDRGCRGDLLLGVAFLTFRKTGIALLEVRDSGGYSPYALAVAD